LSYIENNVVPFACGHVDHVILFARIFAPFFVAVFVFEFITIISQSTASISSQKNVLFERFLIVKGVSMFHFTVKIISSGISLFHSQFTCISLKNSLNLTQNFTGNFTPPKNASAHSTVCVSGEKYLGSSACKTTLNLLFAHIFQSSSHNSNSTGSFIFAKSSHLLSCSSVTIKGLKSVWLGIHCKAKRFSKKSIALLDPSFVSARIIHSIGTLLLLAKVGDTLIP
jgi:hypothetical protein